MQPINFMTDDEFKELSREFLKFRHGFESRDFSDELFSQLTDHRKLIRELGHRLSALEEMLKTARCPSGCEQGSCAWCWDRNIELTALETYHKELQI
jgi:cobalamin biosynthesis Co2+ chelatase CbiK